MSFFKKRSLFYVLLCFSALFLCSCNQNTSDTSNEKIVLNEVAHSLFYAPMYVAIEEGYFKEQGLDVTLITGFGADKTMTALLSGEADIGFMGSEASIYTYVEGASDYAVNFAQLTQRAGNFLVAREPINDFTWSDVKGSYVLGGRKGGMPEMVFEYILKKYNIDPLNDLTIDKSIDFGSTAAAFAGAKEGETNYPDFTVEFEPHATGLEEQGKGYVVASLGTDSGYVPYTAFCTRKSYLDSHPETIQKFTNAIQKGLDYVQNHSAKEIATVIHGQFKETDISTAQKIIERYQNQDTWKSNTIFEEDSFALLQSILIDAGELSTPAPYKDLVNTTYSRKACE